MGEKTSRKISHAKEDQRRRLSASACNEMAEILEKASGEARRPMMRPKEKLRVERVERAMPRIRREKLAVRVVVWWRGCGGMKVLREMAAARGAASERMRVRVCVAKIS